jgi:Domain of unknown function (DUF4149)
VTAARRLELLVAILWAGSLWTICGLVAPMLFRLIDDRAVAGRIAGAFFRIEAWIGVGAALMIFGLRALGRSRADRPLAVAVALGAALPVASTLLLGPLMEIASTQGDAARFGLLHGAAALAFGMASIAVLIVVLRVTRPAA